MSYLRENMSSPLLPGTAAFASGCAIGFGFVTATIAEHWHRQGDHYLHERVYLLFADIVLFFGIFNLLGFMTSDNKSYAKAKPLDVMSYWSTFSRYALAMPWVSYVLVCACALGFCFLTVEIDAEYKRRSYDDATNNTEQTKKHTNEQLCGMIFGDVACAVLGMTLLAALLTAGLSKIKSQPSTRTLNSNP